MIDLSTTRHDDCPISNPDAPPFFHETISAELCRQNMKVNTVGRPVRIPIFPPRRKKNNPQMTADREDSL
jgi:hypothetical protein